jgi:GntR family transcriptional regulator
MTINTRIDRNSHVPYYIQVKDALLDYIQTNDWQNDRLLPSEPELCQKFDVSRTVIRQAMKELEFQGAIRREKGKGTFINEAKIDEGMVQELTGFYQDMVQRGQTPVTKVLRQELAPASARVANRLQLEVNESVVEIHRLRGLKDGFFILDTTYLPYSICPEVLDADLAAQSLYAFLENKLGLVIARGHRTLEAVLANEYEAALLQIKKGDPLILLDSVVYLDDGRPIEYFHAVHRGGRARFEVELIRVRK